ncbi:MAG TPA: diaminopimelate decarboxylase [Solirubrobacteraceae bacterium]|jgi:diaminopimelate decarboxylase|nr:diaminopimelate decarboxylase [Solirubrobacteraceae bacterium]
MATETMLSDVFPLGSRVNERGRLEVGGCDAIELAREFGTPAYVVAEDDLRARARAFGAAARDCGRDDLAVVFASKAFPCTAVLELLSEEGLWCDVASGGELHLALAAGFAPERIVMHGNAKSDEELRTALARGVGLIVLDNFDEIDRLRRLVAEVDDGGAREVLIRVTPDVRGETHEKISTGQADSKFGFSMSDARAAIARVRELDGMRLAGLHAHIGSQLLDLDPFRREVAELAALDEFDVWDLGGGLGVRYTSDQPAPPSVESYVATLLAAAAEHGMTAPGRRLLVEPGRALCANACVTLYTVQSVKQNVSRWVAVDGGMSDNLRPMMYGAVYEAHVADRLHGTTRCVLAGKHCESGDVIVRDALLDDPRPGDVVVTPATGAYGYAMANNYNGVPRPPVIFCRDGDARVVVRRETFEDLTARDVR